MQWTFIDEIAAATRDPGRVRSLRQSRSANLRRSTSDHPIYPIARSPDRALVLQRRSAVALRRPCRRSTRRRFFAMLSRVMPRRWRAVGRAVVGRADSPRAVRASRGRRRARVCTCWRAIRRLPTRCGRRAGASSCGSRRRTRCRCSGWRAATAGGSPRASAAIRTSRPTDSSASACSPTSTPAWRNSARRSTGSCSGSRAWSGRCCISRPKRPAPAAPASAASTTTRCTTCSGLTGHAFQSLYHFTIGMPVEDTRLTTEPGYAWEQIGIPSGQWTGH